MRGVSQRWLKLRVQLQSGFHKIRVKFEPKLRVISEVCETPYSLLTKTPSSCIIGPLTHLCHFLGLRLFSLQALHAHLNGAGGFGHLDAIYLRLHFKYE